MMINVEIIASNKEISSSVVFGNDVRIKTNTIIIKNGAHIGSNVIIEGGDVTIEENARIGDNVQINTNSFTLGYDSRIDDFCTFKSLNGQADKIHIGDNSNIYSYNNITVPVLLIGDYVKIHNHTLINGLKPCYIGHNSWIGQNSIINSNDIIFVGNNVGIGAYSSIWTHSFFGELIEGFPFIVAPTVIEDNVWVIGSYNAISPGVTLGNGCMILPSSYVSINIPKDKVAGGTPAKVLVSDKLGKKQYSIDEKFILMKRYVEEYLNAQHSNHFELANSVYKVFAKDGIQFFIEFVDEYYNQNYNDDSIYIVFTKRAIEHYRNNNVTVFDLSTKEYTKRLSEQEIDIIKFMTSYRARFIPKGNTVVGTKPIFKKISKVKIN